MLRRPLILVAFASSLVTGCAASTSPPVAPATAAAAPVVCGAPMPVAAPAYTLEGFGGPGDTQLMMTARQPVRRCAPRDGTLSSTATLGPQQ